MTYFNRIDTKAALLDRPIWSALTTCLAPIAERMGTARAFPQKIGPLAAAASYETFPDFMSLMTHRKEPLITVEIDTPRLAQQCLPEDHVHGVQMIGHFPAKPQNSHKIQDLTKTHATQIFDLAKRTKPGPFASQSHTLGDFIGIFDGPHLIAMAGQRLKLPGFIEISAVCVDPSFQGCGMGAELVRQMSERILDRGDVPFLHAYERNMAAISLYQCLGFQQRARLEVTNWVNNAAVQYD